jgi:hypothetical protein
MTKMRFRPRAFLTSGLANAGYHAALRSDRVCYWPEFTLIRFHFTIMDN